MNTHYLTRARNHFVHEFVPRSTARHNMRQWVASIRMLGDKWLLLTPLSRPNA